MSATHLVDSQYQQYKGIIDEVFQELHHLTLNINNEQLAKTVDNIRTRLHEPFLFVIVGEVKVGKSSFVNALLESDHEICKVAPDPCTDTIQQIIYGDHESTISINEFYKKITIPAEILRQIAIVDTPGTNAVEEQHQEITERFIPISDLIIFVFEAKNPYRQSAWNLLDYVNKEWRKKVIFVLQQADLMEEDDLAVNYNGVIQYAAKRGINHPKVFTVSAKRELNGDTENSGFADVRTFIKDAVTGGNNARLKIQSLLRTSQNIMGNIQSGIGVRKKQLKEDSVFRDKITLLLDNAERKSQKQIELLIDNMLKEYDKIMGDIQLDFEEGLQVFTLIRKSFLSVFNKKEGMKEWVHHITERINNELQPALENRLHDGVLNIADSIRQMATIIDADIQQQKSSIKSNHTIFGDIADKRQDRFEKLQNKIEDFIDETETFLNTETLQKSANLVPNMATGGGLLVIGAILAGVIQGVAFDITGGILSVIGLSIAGVVTLIHRKRISRDFEAEIAKGREQLQEQVMDKLRNYALEIRTKIENNFLEFDAFMDEERKSVDNVEQTYRKIENKFREIGKELELDLS